jgi:hypothetical protein
MPRPKITIEEYRKRLDKIPEIEFARLAAYIDGEGCIAISGSSKPRGRGVSPYHNLQVTVTNTYLPLFDWIASRFGGRPVIANSNYGKPNTKQCYRWVISEIHGEELLRRCMPYFIIKAEQARIGLAFRDIKRRKFDQFHNGPLTEDVIRQRDELQQQISDLNSVKGFGARKLRNQVTVSDTDKVQ